MYYLTLVKLVKMNFCTDIITCKIWVNIINVFFFVIYYFLNFKLTVHYNTAVRTLF